MSLTLCADEMGLPKSTVSKAISKLEEHLQARLLERSTRRIQITEVGEIVLKRASHLVEDFRSLRQDVQEIRQQVQGMIRISAPPAMGAFLSHYIFPPFLEQWPRAQITLEQSYTFDDLFVQGIDLAIRVGQIADDRLIARAIGSTSHVLVASPDYLEKHGAPLTPEALRNHNCVRFQYTSEAIPWTMVNNGRTESIDVSGNFVCPNIEAVKQAVVAGLGIG